MYSTVSQYRRQNIVNRGALRLCGGGLRSYRGGLTFKFGKNPLIYSVSYFNLGGSKFFLEGLSPPKTPRGDGTAVSVSCTSAASYHYDASKTFFLTAQQ